MTLDTKVHWSEKKLTKIPEIADADPREIWPDEQKDFTPWLEKNFNVLCKKIGLKASNVTREERIGDFKVDLKAKEDDTENVVVVENQLSATDHGHLGQLMTYAAGFEAKYVIWVSPEFRPEHKRAMSWLNSITSEEISFFGVEIKARRINESLGFELSVIVQPDEWAPKRKVLSERNQKQMKFYTELLSELRKTGLTTATKGNPDTYQSIGVGSSRTFLEFRFSQEGRFRVAFYINTRDDSVKKLVFDPLFSLKNTIEAAFGNELEWDRRDGQKHCTISIFRDGVIDNDDDELSSLKVWAVEQAVNLKNALEPHKDIWG